jgi:hypothetical protein|tara:strand:+ start:1528 stop:1890 length:363 start_codon:yes stop_codon:yes gene_type:complete
MPNNEMLATVLKKQDIIQKYLGKDEGKWPIWLQRAIDPNTPTTDKNETVRTASWRTDDGIILAPTIRYNIENNKLYKPKDPLDYEDNIHIPLTTVKFKDAESVAKRLSIAISNLINERRN